jgi:hypothetical protein
MCPRCGGRLSAPNIWSSDWICAVHGAVLPLQPPKRPSDDGLTATLRHAKVPVWVPWPLPLGWLVTGFVQAGDDRTGARSCGVALSGPSPLATGPADLLVLAEEPGIGLGAAFAGLDGPDPGFLCDGTAPHAKVVAAGHPVPLWAVDGAAGDRAAYVGEALGFWLWMVLWPAEAGALLLDEPDLRDLREPGMRLDLPYGAFCPRLP